MAPPQQTTPTTEQQIALRCALENLKEASALAVQALRDAAMPNLFPRMTHTSVLGAIESAQHQLEKARANLASAWLIVTDVPALEV
jgi:hypothetical protein